MFFIKKFKTKKLVLSALFLSLGVVLPFFTAQLKEIGDTLLPMHIPVMLCGLICGWHYGLAVGFILPFLRSFLFGMPPMYPNAVWMALEMAVYGLVIGYMYSRKQNYSLRWLYISLVTAMLSGRIAWGIAKALLLGIKGSSFTFTAFIIGGFVDAMPGIVLQLLLIPTIMLILNKLRLKSESEKE